MSLRMPDADALHRFLFAQVPIRGEVVRLNQTWCTVQANRNYPPPLRRAMGELMAAAALLTATLKMQGSMILQLQGHGPVSLLVVECGTQLTMRATAKWAGELPEGGLKELVGDGRFAITLEPRGGRQTYQGIVPLEGGSVADILQNYMMHSEQLETRLWLYANEKTAAGLLLQKLPGRPEQDDDAWNRLCRLAETVQATELSQLDVVTLLRRLFHEEDVRLFEPQPVSFHCGCSRDSVARLLRLLGPTEVHDMLREQGAIEVSCEFCNRRYCFEAEDTEQALRDAVGTYDIPTRH
ncbi:MAG: Hsp33 family molecular chaperone HslO [Methylophilaceae bacterium]|nr:Hsp33 family molecular chaperone HslO [Methylophilaceae bacterium]